MSDFTFSRVFRNQNFEPVTPKQLTDTHSGWERPQNAKSEAQLNPQNAQISSKIFWWSNLTSQGCFKQKLPNSCQGTDIVYFVHGSVHSLKVSVDTESI